MISDAAIRAEDIVRAFADYFMRAQALLRWMSQKYASNAR